MSALKGTGGPLRQHLPRSHQNSSEVTNPVPLRPICTLCAWLFRPERAGITAAVSKRPPHTHHTRHAARPRLLVSVGRIAASRHHRRRQLPNALATCGQSLERSMRYGVARKENRVWCEHDERGALRSPWWSARVAYVQRRVALLEVPHLRHVCRNPPTPRSPLDTSVGNVARTNLVVRPIKTILGSSTPMHDPNPAVLINKPKHPPSNIYPDQESPTRGQPNARATSKRATRNHHAPATSGKCSTRAHLFTAFAGRSRAESSCKQPAHHTSLHAQTASLGQHEPSSAESNSRRKTARSFGE